MCKSYIVLYILFQMYLIVFSFNFYFVYLSLKSTKTRVWKKSTQACRRYIAAQMKSHAYIHSKRLANLLCNAIWWMFQDAGREYLQQAQMMSKEMIFTTETESGVGRVNAGSGR